MTEVQKSLKRKLQNDGLYVDDSTGTPVLKDGKGRVIGGGGGGEKERIIIGCSYNAQTQNYSSNITDEQRRKLYNGVAVAYCVLAGTSPEASVECTHFTRKNNGELWCIGTYFGNLFVIVYISGAGRVLVTPQYYAVKNDLSTKQNTVLYGTGEPSDDLGVNGDVYIQVGD